MWIDDLSAWVSQDVRAASALAGERRRHPRHLLEAPGLVRPADGRAPIPALVSDIGRGGCRVQTLQPTPPAGEVSLAFFLPERGLCGAWGGFARRMPSGFALQFADANRALLQLLDRLDAWSPQRRREVAGSLRRITIEIRTR
jgi:hypothetical protein